MSQDYRDYILDILKPFGAVTARAMFGGHGLYRDGLIFAIIAEDALYFKADKEISTFFETSGSQPFNYESRGKIIALSY